MKLTWRNILRLEDEAQRMRDAAGDPPDGLVMIDVGGGKQGEPVYISGGHPRRWWEIGELRNRKGQDDG